MRFALFLLVVFLSGCESVSDRKLSPETTGLIVVDANITSENKNHAIRLSFPYDRQNGAGSPVSGAFVTLAVDDDLFPLTESPAGSGIYYTPVLRAITGKNYLLNIVYLGRTFSAQDNPPAVEPMDPIRYSEADSLYQLSMSGSGNAPNFIRHQIVWENTPYCTMNCAGEIYFYDLKSADVNEIFKPGKVDFYFPPGSTIIRTKYSVSPAYRSFLRSMLSETEWRGGVFDVQRAPVETNLSGGAIGFFAVSTVVSDTTVVVP